MFSQIRKHLTPTSVLLTFALVLAMSGGAFAATKYLITSTKQISPKVLASLKGAKGANGTPGAQGPAGAPGAKGENGTNGTNGTPGTKGETGPAGPAGPAGPTGKNGAAGTPGTNGANGTNGTNGAPGPAGPTGSEGSPWTAGGTLPPGKTETGTWNIADYNLPSGQVQPFGSSISFPIPLAKASEEPGTHAFYFNEGQTEEIDEGTTVGTSGCKGTLEKPTAPKGTLCIYTALELTKGVEELYVKIPNHPGEHTFPPLPSGDLLGAAAGQYATSGTFLLFTTFEASAELVAHGDWAVTAPEAP